MDWSPGVQRRREVAPLVFESAGYVARFSDELFHSSNFNRKHVVAKKVLDKL